MNIERRLFLTRAGVLGALAGLGLVACASPAAGPAQQAPAGLTASPLPSPQVEPSPLPSEAPAEQGAEPERRMPLLVAVAEGMVFEIFPGAEPREIAVAPAGALAAAVSGDTLLVLRASDVVSVDLRDGAATTVATLDARAMYGSVRLLPDQARFVYTAVVEDNSTPFGMGTRIGIHTLGEAQARPVLSEPTVYETLGYGVENELLYLLPRGQDPGIGRVQMRSLSDGALTTELSIEGEGYAQLDPVGRNLAVSARIFDGVTGDGARDMLHMYDLMAVDMQKQPIALPEAPSAATSAIWSPNGGSLYFTLSRGNIYEAQGSMGLWALDLGTESPRLVSAADLGERRISAISPDGNFLILGAPAGDQPLLAVDLAAGTTTELALPQGALLAGWR